MAFPADVKLVRVTCGTGYDFSGDPIAITLEVAPVLGGSLKRLIHAATGTFMTRDALTFKSDPGSPATFTVPSPAQAETWKDGSGEFFTNWSYSVTVTTRTASGKIQSWIQSFQPVAGQETVDLDLVPDGQIGSPTSAPAPAVTSVNGQSGAVVIDGGEAVTPESVAANLTVEAVDAKLPERLSESALSAAIDDSIAPIIIKTGTDTVGPNTEIVGHSTNEIASDVTRSVILGGGVAGYNNIIGGLGANVDTATPNTAELGTGAHVSVVGGYDNSAGALSSKIISDHSKTEKSTTGGGHNSIYGGSGHVITGLAGFSAIVGGLKNIARGLYNTVGGYMNDVMGQGSTAFGTTNTLTGNYTFATGAANTVNGIGSRAQGSTNTTDSLANFSSAEGNFARARQVGQHVTAEGRFAILGDAQSMHMNFHKLTTDATTTNLGYLNVTTGYQLPINTSCVFKYIVVARDQTGTDTAAWEVTGAARRGTSGAPAFIGAPTVTKIGNDTGAAQWTLDINVDSIGGLNLRGTGEAAKNIRWVARGTFAEVAV